MMRTRMLLFGAGLLFCHQTVNALSLCTDPDGRQILTDAPGQLLNCAQINADHRSHSVPAAPPPPSPPADMVTPADPVPANPPVATAHAGSVRVPLERLGGLLIVTVHLNHDRQAKLILDTGASHSLLSHRMAQELGLFSFPPVALVTLQTVSGAVQAEVVQVESIELAGAEVRHSLAAIHDMPDAPPGIEGLLGQSFLRQFEVTVNAAKGELHLKPAR